MNTLSTLIEPVGWALLHFLWQGAAIAVLLRGFLWLTRRRSPQVRYAAAGAAMLVMLGAAVCTVCWQWPAPERDAATPQAISAPVSLTSLTGPTSLIAPLEDAVPPQSAPEPAELQIPPGVTMLPAAPPAVETPTTADRLRPLLPWMVGMWAAGVLFFSLRLLNGWRVVRRWRATANNAIPGDWAHRFSCLCERLGIRRTVRLLSSATLAVPVVIGWLKPVVLVPASLFTGLSAAQLEALLAHELAHVRRHDYLVNLLQSALETLFFYHPAVWWVSGQLRIEREHCCDDTATVHAGGVIDYARALTALEEMRAMPSALGVSAAGGSLLQRIRRLAGVSEKSATGLAWPLGLLTLAAVAVALPFTLLHTAEAQEKEPAVASADAPVIRGFSLAGIPSTTDAVHLNDLYEPDPEHPGKFTQKFEVFEMPIYSAAGEPWLKYPAGGGAFYIELKDRTYGPIPGDPMAILKLTDLLRGKLKEDRPNDALLRLRKMIYRGDDALRSTAYALMQELTEPKWRFDYDELITTSEEALKKAPASPSATAGAAALARVKSLADAAKAAWDKSRVTLPDSDYSPGLIPAEMPGVIWNEPDASGLSIGIAGLKDGAAWKPGDQIEFALWIRNDSKEPVKFTWTPRTDEGLRMWATDGKLQRHEAEMVMNTSLLVPDRTRLEPGQRLELKKVTLNIVAANSDGTPPARGPGEGSLSRLVLPNGTWSFIVEARIGSFEMQDGQGNVTVPAAGEWTGTLLTPEVLVHSAKSTVGEIDQEASDSYLKAYLQLLEADKLNRDGRIEEALKTYQSVSQAFDQIAREHPKWNTNIVEYRRKKTAGIIADLEKKQKGSGTVEPPAAVAPDISRTGPDVKRPGSTGNTLAAIVNGRPVLKSEVEELMKTSVMDLRRRFPDQAELNAEMKKLRAKVLDSLIDQELILQEYAPFAATFESKVEARVDELIPKQFVDGLYKGDRQKFLQALDDSGIGYKKFREQQKKNVIVDMMLGQFAKVDSPRVTDEEKAAWLKTHGDLFREGVKLKLNSITISGTAEGKTREQQRALADEVRAKLANGADFATVARAHSTDSKRDAGGSWGWMEKKDLSSAFWPTVSALEPGKISDVIPLGGNFYIFLVDDRQEGKMKPQAEIDAEVERRIQMERRQESSEAWLKKLREKAEIKIFAAAGESDQQRIAEKIAESEEFRARAIRPLIGNVLKGGNSSKHEETAALLKLWRAEYKEVPVIPAVAMQRLAVQVNEYVEKYPGEAADKMKAQLPAMEKDSPWTWEAAQELIDSICDASTAPVGWMNLKEEFRSFDRVKPGQKWTDEQHAKLSFGPAAKNGLRAAWVFDPLKDTYAVGEELKCRIILHNSGKEPLEFRTDQWHQMEQLEVHDAAGNQVEVKTSFLTGISPWFRFKLEPGQVCEVGSSGIVVGKAATGEGAYGVEIPTKPGDELTCHRGVNIEWGTGSKDGSGGEGIPHYLTTGEVKFKVTAPDPKAAPKVGALPPSAILQFRLVTDREGPDTEPVEPAENWSDLPTFHLRKSAIVTAADVKSATAELDKASGRWQINLVFSEEGAAALARVTKENIGRQLAIVGNGKVISAPVIQGEMGKQVMLTGNYLESEAKELVNAIQAAAPAKGAASEPAADRKIGELVINVMADGSVVFDGKSLTLEELTARLAEITKFDKKRAIIIRGTVATAYEKIVAVLDVTHKAGLHHVSFATTTEAPAPAAGLQSVIGSAHSTGLFDLGSGVKLEITQVATPAGGGILKLTNTATIQWPAGGGKDNWPIELSPGPAIDTIVWRRGTAGLWIIQGKSVRKIDFSNAADVKEQNWTREKSGDFGGAPGDVLKLIREFAGSSRKFVDEIQSPNSPGNGGGSGGVEEGWKVVSLQGRHYVTADAIRKFYAFSELVREGKAVILRSPEHTLRLEPGTDNAVVGNARYALSYPVVEKDGQFLISLPDLITLIDPALQPEAGLDKLLFDTVVIDPGHGGADEGSVSSIGTESNYNLDIALRLRASLEKEGIKVVLTRAADVFVQRPARVEIANATPGAVFISIHAMSGTVSSSGLETYALAPAGAPNSGKAFKPGDNTSHPGNQNNTANAVLAARVHQSVLQKLHQKDGGIRRHRFDVLAGVQIPAMLIEAGYLSNPAEAARMNTPEHRQDLAQAITDGLLQLRVDAKQHADKKTAQSPPANPPAPASGSVPNAPEPPSGKSSAPVPNGAVRVELLANGSFLFDGAACDEEAFKTKLAAIAKVDPNRAVILKAGADVEFKWVQRVLELVNESGLKQIGLSTERKGKEPLSKAMLNRAEAQRLLETNRLLQEKMPDEARKALTQIVALLGNPGDDGFQPEDSLLLAEAQFELGRLDGRQAGTQTPLSEASTLLLNSAVAKHTDGLKLLIEYDQDHPKSVAGRSLMALGYMEIGQFLARKGEPRDASVAFNESVKVYLELLEEQPGDAGHISGLALTYNEAAALIRSIKPGKEGALEALEYQNLSVESVRKLPKEFLNGAMALRFAAFIFHNGELRELTGDTAAAQKCFAEVLTITAALLGDKTLSDGERSVVQSLSDQAKAKNAPDAPPGDSKPSPAPPGKDSQSRRSEAPAGWKEGTFEHKDGTRTEIQG